MYSSVPPQAFEFVTETMGTIGKARTYYPVQDADPVPGWGSARVAAYRHLPEVLSKFGVDFQEVLEAVGLPVNVFANPDTMVAYPDLGHLLLESVRQSNCDYIGLLLAQRVRLSDMGLAGQIAACGETVGEGLQNFSRFFTLQNSAATISVIRSSGFSRLVYAIAEPDMADTGQLQLGAMTIAFNILQDLCGHGWMPAVVTVASRAPCNLRPCQRFFRAPLRFDSDESAVVFESHWLDRPLPLVAPLTRQLVEDEVKSRQSLMLANFPSAVRRALRKQLLIGPCSIDAVATQFGMHRRTLDRRLARHGVHYGELLDAVRHEAACQLLRDTGLQVQQIAESLRYSSAANFSTAFRRWTGLSPTDFRRTVG
jgi:AraC-like DNA-binding protein